MQVNNQFTKIAVLLFFILFISGFVAYRSGAFDKIFPGREKTNSPVSIPENVKDTIKPGVDTTGPKRTIMSSSKSMILIDEKTPKNDSLPKKAAKDSLLFDNQSTLPSSKSGRIMLPGDLKSKNVSDSNKKTKKDSISKPSTLMNSSKSGILIYPKDTTKKN